MIQTHPKILHTGTSKKQRLKRDDVSSDSCYRNTKCCLKQRWLDFSILNLKVIGPRFHRVLNGMYFNACYGDCPNPGNTLLPSGKNGGGCCIATEFEETYLFVEKNSNIPNENTDMKVLRVDATKCECR